MRRQHRIVNALIILFALCFFVVGLVGFFSYEEPTNLKEQTGNVAKIQQYDEKWYDFIFGGSSGSYFRVTLADGAFFEATGICYDNIDRGLFEDLKVGDEITITYEGKFGRPNRIYAIEYNGLDYSSLESVLLEFRKNRKIWKTVGAFMMGGVGGGRGFVVC